MHHWTGSAAHSVSMVQTREGAQQNDWLTFMRSCRMAYQAHKAAMPPKERPKKERPRKGYMRRGGAAAPLEGSRAHATTRPLRGAVPGSGGPTRLTLDAYAAEPCAKGAAAEQPRKETLFQSSGWNSGSSDWNSVSSDWNSVSSDWNSVSSDMPESGCMVHAFTEVKCPDDAIFK